MRNIRKILFLGNSITYHSPNPDIGWSGNWGMAASSVENDYVHILMRRIHSIDSNIRFMIKNVADYERVFWDYELTKLKECREFNADLIIMRIAENVDDEQAKEYEFGKYYLQLINYVNPSNSKVICTNGFWDQPNTSQTICEVASKEGYDFIGIHHLSCDIKNMARDEFWHEGVGSHPSDQGMKAIADMIWERVKILLK